MARSVRSPLDRIAGKYMPEPNSGCWLWTDSLDRHGYGQFNVGCRTPGRNSVKRAHRVMYELLVGPVPVSLDLDHRCRTRSCVNPDHLEPVTRKENLGRSPLVTSDRGRDACREGHRYTTHTTRMAVRGAKVTRRCRVCDRIAARRSRDRRAA